MIMIAVLSGYKISNLCLLFSFPFVMLTFYFDLFYAGQL